MYRCKVRLIAEFCVDTFYIVIVHKIIQIQITHVLQIFYRMCDLKIVMIVVSAVKSFVQRVVGYAVQCSTVDPAAVISVNNLTHQPEIFFHFVCGTAQGMHKVKIKYICRIQPDAIDIKLRYPKTDHIADIILHFRISLI